jgi:hypothetical protein
VTTREPADKDDIIRLGPLEMFKYFGFKTKVEIGTAQSLPLEAVDVMGKRRKY